MQWKSYPCHDGFCGAEDCPRCCPGGDSEEEPDDDDEDPPDEGDSDADLGYMGSVSGISECVL